MISPRNVQRTLGWLAALCVVAGVLGLWARFSEIFSFHYLPGTVMAVEPYQGECRRPSGRTEQCVLYHAQIQYLTPQESTPRTGKLDILEKGVTLTVGSVLQVAVSKSSPETVLLPEISEGWKPWFTLLTIAGLLLLIRSAVAGGSQTAK